MLGSIIFAVTALTAAVSAQSGNFTTCCDVVPTTVELNTRLSWCRAQTNTCPLLCTNGQTSQNTCDPQTLTYQCQCLSGNTPNISDYGQTLPSLECDAWVGQCTNAHPNDLNGQTFCQSFICGKKNASALARANTGSSGSSASPSASPTTGTTNSSTGNTASATPSTAAAAALQLGKQYGTAGIAVGVLALFGLAL